MSLSSIVRLLAVVCLSALTQFSFAATAPTNPAGLTSPRVIDAELQGKRVLLAQMAKEEGGPMVYILATPREAADGTEPLFRKLVETMIASGYQWVKDEKNLHPSIKCKVAVTSVVPKSQAPLLMIDVRCGLKTPPETGLSGKVTVLRAVHFRAGLDVGSATNLIPGLINEAFGEAVLMTPK